MSVKIPCRWKKLQNYFLVFNQQNFCTLLMFSLLFGLENNYIPQLEIITETRENILLLYNVHTAATPQSHLASVLYTSVTFYWTPTSESSSERPVYFCMASRLLTLWKPGSYLTSGLRRTKSIAVLRSRSRWSRNYLFNK